MTSHPTLLMVLALPVIAGSVLPLPRATAGQEEAIAAIKKLGGKVMIDNKRDGKPVVGVDLSDTKVTDADLALLKQLPDLQLLRLAVTGVTGDGLEHLKGLKKLDFLVLERTKITDKSLARLKVIPSLQTLDLGGTSVGDEGVAHLKSLDRLVFLNLSMTKVTDAGIAHLKDLKQLEELGLLIAAQIRSNFSESHDSRRTSVCGPFSAISANWAAVRNLTLFAQRSVSFTKITDAGLLHLRGMSSLKSLDLSSTKVTAKGIKALQDSLPKTNIMENTK